MRVIFLSIFLFVSFLAQAQDFYDVNSIREVRLHFSDPDWATTMDKNKAMKKRLIADYAFINGQKLDSVGVRYKGNSSYNSPRKKEQSKFPFNIKVNSVNKDQTIRGGYTTLKLANIFMDPSSIREVLAYEIARKYMVAPQANFVKLFINGDYIGLYTSVESIDDKFLEENLNYKKGNPVFKCDPDWRVKQMSNCKGDNKSALAYLGSDSLCYFPRYEIKSKTGWRDLVAVCKALSSEPNQLSDRLDIDRALWMIAFNNVLVNLDSYSGRLGHNYYMAQDNDGRFNPLVWDLNMAFGSFRFSESGKALSVAEMIKMSPLLHIKNPKRPLISQLLANPVYQKMYLAHMRTILEENFKNRDYLKRGEAFQRRIDFEVKQDPNSFYTYEDFKANLSSSAKAGAATIVGIEELMGRRTEYLLSHPLLTKAAPEISKPTVTLSEGKATIKAQIKGGSKAILCYRIKGNSAFVKTRLLDTGEKGDTQAKDGWFSRTIEKEAGKIIEYYVYADSGEAIQFSPKRAAFEFYEIR